MTIWDSMRALLRRWYISLIALVVAMATSLLMVNAKGVYWSNAEVTFLAPTSTLNPNALRTTSSDLITTAGIVARLINGNTTWNEMADPSATLVGEGVLDGWSVRLPDYGGQWSSVHSRQVLDVQVTGPTPEAVLERYQALVAQIDAELLGLQEGVPPRDRITTIKVPGEPEILYVGGSRPRALFMLWLLCGAAALTASSLIELRMRRPFKPSAGLDHR
jgi:hypothetical protein